MERALTQAYQLLDNGENESAREAFAQIVQEEPSNLDALLGLGKALARLGHYEEALAVCQKVLQVRPELAEAHYVLGWILIRLKRWSEAEQHILFAVAAEPANPKYHFAAAGCADKRKDLEGVLTHLKAAYNLDPTAFNSRKVRWALTYASIFAGLEKLGFLMGWTIIATIWAYVAWVTHVYWWFLAASFPFFAISGWNFKRRRYRRAVWALVLYVLWAMLSYWLVKRLLG